MVQHLPKSRDHLFSHVKELKKAMLINIIEIYNKRWKKRFQCLNWRKKFLWLTRKKWRRSLWKTIENSKNNDCKTANLLDFAYFNENYRLIAIDLGKQTKLKDPQQISSIGKLEGQNNRATIFFIIEKSEETTFEFLQNSVNVL